MVIAVPPDELVFALEGYWGTDPDELAEVLEVQREQLRGSLPDDLPAMLTSFGHGRR